MYTLSSVPQQIVWVFQLHYHILERATTFTVKKYKPKANDECFVRKLILKFRVSKYHLRYIYINQLHVYHKYDRNNYYIRPYLDARWFFSNGGSSTTTGEVKIIFYLFPFYQINKLYSNVDGASKFTQNDIIIFQC